MNMNGTPSRAVLAMACLAATSLVDVPAARAQQVTSDSLACVHVSTDRRFAKTPDPFTLTPDDAQFMTSQGCKVVGGTRIARADRLCYPVSVDERGSELGVATPAPDADQSGADLSGQVFLCYDVRCERDELDQRNRTELTITDRFGDGQIFINERPTTKELCVPAFVAGGPSPTPSPTLTPIVTPTPGATATATPSPTPVVTATPSPTATPGATGTPGSASLAFVERVPSLLR